MHSVRFSTALNAPPRKHTTSASAAERLAASATRTFAWLATRIAA